MEVKVSLIIPVYGVENFLERAVDSALDQTLEEKEINGAMNKILNGLKSMGIELRA